MVGTRRPGQAAIESKSPVTVVGGERLRERGGGDMLDLLRDAVPSFNVNMQPIADGATVVRPPNVRNLAADHTLVLVNGKRRHRGAVIAWLVPKASEGAQGPDLSVIPAIAVERVEVLADGASAQYGSDARAQPERPFRARQPLQPVHARRIQRPVRVPQAGAGLLTGTSAEAGATMAEGNGCAASRWSGAGAVSGEGNGRREDDSMRVTPASSIIVTPREGPRRPMIRKGAGSQARSTSKVATLRALLLNSTAIR